MNEQNSFNLIDEPWISVLLKDGLTRIVSLSAIFSPSGTDILDLCLAPYERVALTRFLLAITHSALGPERLRNEVSWLAAKDLIAPVCTEYLSKWHDRFFLYGSHAFMQPDDLALANADGAALCDKLAFRFASGNNSTLFDHAATSGQVRLQDASLAIAFLSYQNFSAGGLSPTCNWSGYRTESSVKGSPCRESSMLFTILTGENLLETIWLNLLTKDMVEKHLRAEWGKCAWELDDLSRLSTANLANTLLGRLAPLSRAIKFTCASANCILGEAVRYPALPEWREPMATVKPNKEEKPVYVSVDPARMPWRDLSSILATNQSHNRKGALALLHLNTLQDKDFAIWTGGLCSKKGQPAKEDDTMEWKAQLSVSLLDDPSLRMYQEAINHADRQLMWLVAAAKEYAEAMKVKKENASRYSDPAVKTYWDILAQSENQHLVLAVDSTTYLDDWKAATRKAAEEAYKRACPSMTARQMEAFTQGLGKLFDRPNTGDQSH